MAAEHMETGRDILQAVLEDMGELAIVDSGDYLSQVKRYIREAYWDVMGRHRWNWAMAPNPGVIVTEASVHVAITGITGPTVTLTESIADSMAGRKFFLDGHQSVYRIQSHAAGTATLTLDAVYVEPGLGGSGTIYQDEYETAADVLRIWEPFQVRGQWWQQLRILQKTDFEMTFGRGWSVGPAPYEAAMELPRSVDGVKRYRFAPWSEERVALEYDYTMFHDLDFSGNANTDTPKVPHEFRSAIIDLALYKGLYGKDDTRATDAKIFAENTINEMLIRYLPTEGSRLRTRPRNSLSLGCT